jgi:hypothetical protein
MKRIDALEQKLEYLESEVICLEWEASGTQVKLGVPIVIPCSGWHVYDLNLIGSDQQLNVYQASQASIEKSKMQLSELCEARIKPTFPKKWAQEYCK